MYRRKFIRGIVLLAGGAFALPVIKTEQEKAIEEVFVNHHTIHWFNDKGIIIKVEKIKSDSDRTKNFCEHIYRREDVLRRLL